MLKETADINVISVEKRSREFSYYGSFRVTISRQDFNKALKPEYWPEGWSVREYFHARKRPENKTGDSSRPESTTNRRHSAGTPGRSTSVNNAANFMKTRNMFNVLPSEVTA